MKELMLKLLTYEPYEQVSGNEKEYIDEVLNGAEEAAEESLLEYDDLFRAFMNHLLYTPQSGICWKKVKWEKFHWLSDWKCVYYPAENYMNGATRKTYSVLFKKICFFWITEGNLSDKVFMQGIGLRQNILNKWQISPRYRKLINKDTYSSINLYRNGKKQSYLVLPIKAAYYESGRQTAPIRFFDPGETAEWIAPKADQLPPFIDVFAGTGTVAASMNTKEKLVNDIDVGAVCFLYAMAHDTKEVLTRLVQLYNNFVSRNIAHARWYTSADWEKHRDYYSQYAGNEKFQEVMIRIRNNYQDIQMYYEKAVCGVVPDFENPSPADIIMFYDIGVAWLFLNSIRPKSYRGNRFHVIDMDIASCLAFLRNTAGIDVKITEQYAKCHKEDNSDAAFLEQYKISVGQVGFVKGKTYMKTLKDAVIRCEDFRTVIKMYDEGFLYLDSPYFLTTDYQIPFKDEEHKQMLDLLRESEADWIFSMQYKAGRMKKRPLGRLKNQKDGQPIIKNEKEYFEGFLYPFQVVYEKGLPFYIADKTKPNDEKKQLWVMLFDDSRNVSGEMMICNFDVRRVFPYEKNSGTVVFPFDEFLKAQAHSKCYSAVVEEAKQWRADFIASHYASGEKI